MKRWVPDDGLAALLVSESRDMAAFGDPDRGWLLDSWRNLVQWWTIRRWRRRTGRRPTSPATYDWPSYVRAVLIDGRWEFRVGQE